MRQIIQILRFIWVSPWTLMGIFLGICGIATGGGFQRVGRVLEFHGGMLQSLLKRAPIVGGASAITIGHTVLARTIVELDRTRAHELVHVRQYERWGPLFVPAYFLASVYMWFRGYDAYMDNPFEKEAYAEAP